MWLVIFNPYFFTVIRNRNTIASDASPISPGGVRLGSCAMTTRMVDEDGFKKIGGFLIRARDIAINIQERRGHFLQGEFVGYEVPCPWR